MLTGSITPSPVTVDLLSPTNGAVISNTVTLSAAPFSTAAPITKVEYYLDGVLIATVTNPIPPPTNLTVTELLSK